MHSVDAPIISPYVKTPVEEIVKRRFSCRAYRPSPIPAPARLQLQTFLSAGLQGPFGTGIRLELIAATEEDRRSLKGLGTYGFIKDPPGFIVGAMRSGVRDLEDFGYVLERAVLSAVEIGLDTCWLGGSFTRSSFARSIGTASDEIIPAVVSVGYGIENDLRNTAIHRRKQLDRRLPEERLFFHESYGVPLTAGQSGVYAAPLDMVRRAPSASNKQPWRVVRCGHSWHFILQRTKGYGKGTLTYTLLRLADLQRVDMGIAMCHFELAARELGLSGGWTIDDPGLPLPEGAEYSCTWNEGRNDV